MKITLIFLITAAVSFAGSLQLGPVNLTVIQSVLKKNLRMGLWVALGGCLPEMIYAAAAVWAGMWLEHHPRVWKLLEWSAVPVLLILGTVTFFLPHYSFDPDRKTQRSFSFIKGLTVGLANPQLFPYWLVMLIQLDGYDGLRVQTFSEQIAFIVGTAVGALGLLAGVAYLTAHFRERLSEKLNRWNMNRFLGVLFVLLGIGQFFKLWWRQ